jgi:hypothetical protein
MRVLRRLLGERVELILGRGRAWSQVEFTPSDAVAYRQGRLLTPDRAGLPEGGETVPGAWDHEHCAICWATIDAEAPEGCVSDQTCVCPRCYHAYVLPRSIDFIRESGTTG